MGVVRVSLTRTKTGLWKGRKEIPENLRAAYGKREEKKTWPASLTHGQALALYMPWRAKIESALDILRQQNAGLVRLSREQARALAGDWYREMIASDLEAGLSSEGWGEPDWEATKANAFNETYDDETGEARWTPGIVLVEERDALLESRGLHVSDESAAMLLEELGSLYLAFWDRLQRRSEGDTAADPILSKLPSPSESRLPAPRPEPKVMPKAAVSISELFERYAVSGAASPRTVSKWRPQVRSFTDHLGHDDATKVTRGDLNRWVESLVARGLAKSTITDSYIPAVRDHVVPKSVGGGPNLMNGSQSTA